MIIQANSLRPFPLAAGSVHMCVTSPPYYQLRDYGVEGQLGLEATPEQYIENMISVFREVRRVLHDSGTLWVNIGDSYSNPGDVVYDPFAGLGTVPLMAIRLGRRGHGVELNPDYYAAAVRYCQAEEQKAKMPTLFDLLALEPAEVDAR